MDTILKDMLMSLQSSLQAHMLSFMHNFGHSVTVIEDRLSEFENYIDNISTTINDINRHPRKSYAR